MGILYVKTLLTDHFHKVAPSDDTILCLVKAFRDVGSVLNQNSSKSGRKRSIRTEDAAILVYEKYLRSPNASGTQRLIKNVGAVSYPIQVLSHMKTMNKLAPVGFCVRVLAWLCVEDTFLDNWSWSDDWDTSIDRTRIFSNGHGGQ